MVVLCAVILYRLQNINKLVKIMSEAKAIKACIHCTQALETSFDLLFLEQINQLLCIGVPEAFAVYAGLDHLGFNNYSFYR